MTAIMWGRTFRRAAAPAAVALVVVLAAIDSASAQPAAGQAPGQAANETVDAAELGRLFDAYTVMQAQEALGLDEAKFGPFVTRLKALQEIRRRNLRERAMVMRELRRLLQTPGNDVQLKERLDALVKLETATRAEQSKA